MTKPSPTLLAAVALVGCGAEAPVPAAVAPSPDLAMTAAPAVTPAPAPPALAYPKTRVDNVTDTLHGVPVRDPYRWLEDGKSPDVQAWMKAEDELARAELHKLPERDAIAARLKELYYIDSISAPSHRGDRYFYSRRLATREPLIVDYLKQKDLK